MLRWLLPTFVAAGPVLAQTPSSITKAAETITTTDVVRHVSVIADDSMQGRNTPSPGLEMTAQYVADQFQQFGLKPGGENSTWFQRYAIPEEVGRSVGGSAPNTVGILEGKDSKLRKEYIVFSAHMDHKAPKGRKLADNIYNGADDNASGTAGIIELAEAFSQPGARPRRSIIFLTVSGEERRDLWGSSYFVEHPPVPVGQMVANINLDMISRNWKDTIVAIGKEHSDLGATLERVVAAHPELKMAAIDDLWPYQFLFYRSDQISFARGGVPVLFFFSGLHEDYHQVSDSPDKIDAEKATRVLRLVYYLGQEIANAEARPKWNEGSYKRIVKR